MCCGEECFSTAFFVFKNQFYSRGCFTIIKNSNGKEHEINEAIGFPDNKNVRVISDDGEQFGIMPFSKALETAYSRDLDLVLMSAQSDPPVCKIMDYGKYRFERDKKEKEAKKKQKVTEVKEIRLSPNIDENDLNTKANQAKKFLTKGDKVKVALRFRGREMAHMATSKQILDSFFEKVSDVAVIEKPAKMEGRSMIMFLGEKR